jgi:hypothetical protein
VGALAAVLADTDYHEKGDRHCPLYYNAERLYERLIERLKFDADCRRHLKKSAPDDLPALDTLLGLFHDTPVP